MFKINIKIKNQKSMKSLMKQKYKNKNKIECLI